MGATEKIPLMVSIWTPIIALSLINLIMIININEKVDNNSKKLDKIDEKLFEIINK